jgi:hypothetical protein
MTHKKETLKGGKNPSLSAKPLNRIPGILLIFSPLIHLKILQFLSYSEFLNTVCAVLTA